MATVQLELDATLKAHIDAQLGEGGFADISDYVSALIRRDEQRREWLIGELQKGLDSGISSLGFDEIVAQAFEQARRKCA